MEYYKYCLRCGRRLRNEEARTIGYGKICLKRVESRADIKPLIPYKKPLVPYY